MTNIANKALICQLTISQWLGRKFDKKATQDVANLNNTATNSGRYNKALLPMSDALNDIYKKTTLIRLEYYKNTLPWGIKDTNLLPSKNYLEYMTLFRQGKSEWFDLVDKFLSDYPRLQLEAERYLGDLYNPDDYPNVSMLKNKFAMDMVLMPVPTDDFRVSISDEELDKVQKDVGNRVDNASENAMQEAWQRLYDKVKHMSDKLADPKSVFRDTIVDNIVGLCDVLKRLNIHDDPNLESLRQEVETSFANEIPESLRNDINLRNRKAHEANAIMKKMNVYMGGTKNEG